jgi:hypothetical protein
LGDDSTAIKYFIKSGDRYNLKHLYLGDSYLRLWKADKALESYQTYQQKEPEERHAYVKKQIAHAELLQRYLRRVERLQVIDSMEVPLESMLDVVQLSAEAGKLTLSATNSVTYTNQRNDRKLWASADGERSWIVSSHNLMDTWTQPDTLPVTINMSSKQDYPYLLSDGVTLYFASKDTSGLGGYDIYVSRYNTYTESYTNPENLGLPFNSPANDYLMVIDEIHHVGYFATDRYAKEGHVHVYSFVPTSEKSYWRNISQDSLVAYAQLRDGLHVEEELVEKPALPQHTMDAERDKEEIFFVLNDSVVYTSMSEFKSATARNSYQEWHNMHQQMKLDKDLLARLRLQYATSDDATKKELTPQILQLEKKQSQSQEQCNKLLQTVRKSENEVNQQ